MQNGIKNFMKVVLCCGFAVLLLLWQGISCSAQTTTVSEIEPNNLESFRGKPRLLQDIPNRASARGALPVHNSQGVSDSHDFFALGGSGSLIMLYVEMQGTGNSHYISLYGDNDVIQTLPLTFDSAKGLSTATLVYRARGAASRSEFFVCIGKNSPNDSGEYVVHYKRTNGKRFLFDASKRENAGHADWQIDGGDIINGVPETELVPAWKFGITVGDQSNKTAEYRARRFPTPSQLLVADDSPETFWSGGLSAWGVELARLGNAVETLPSGSTFTFNTETEQDLQLYDVLILCEPNKQFTPAEKKAIMEFIRQGGGLIMLADHTTPVIPDPNPKDSLTPSDRDMDGKDSPRIFNDLMLNNGINDNSPFGFTVDSNHIAVYYKNNIYNTEYPSVNVNPKPDSNGSAILNGVYGKTTKLAFYDGCTATINPRTNPSVQGLFWQNANEKRGNTRIMALVSVYGSGRIVFIGDSAPADDGTGDPSDKLHPGWSDVKVGNTDKGVNQHRALFIHASLWAAKQ